MACRRVLDVTNQDFLDELTAEDSFDEIYSYGSDDEFGDDLNVGDGNETDDSVESSDDEPLAPGPWKTGSFEPIIPSFKPTMKPGPIASLRMDDPTPLDVFKLFVTESSVAGIVSETNTYADSHYSDKEGCRRKRQWRPTTACEMWAFLGLILAMGMVKIGNIRDYWSTDNIFKHPFFPSVMPRDRFLDILTFFHLNDNRNMARRGTIDFDPLFKVRPFLETIKSRFQSLWYPYENIAVDEATVAWRGNLSFRVFNKDKPDKYGIKIYEACDSKNGYCLDFEVYSGKKIASNKGATYDVVMRLISSFLHQGYTLFVDNFYTSPTLATDLLAKKTTLCGTVRLNRIGLDPSMKTKKTVKKKGDSRVMNNENINHIKFMDNKEVNVLTTRHSDMKVDTGKLHKVTKEPITRFEAVHAYNQYMGAVDRSDQMVQYAAFKRKTLKWWKKLFFHFFVLAEVNAYLWYKQYCINRSKKTMSHSNFRKELAKALVSQVPNDNIAANPGVGESSLFRLKARHFPSSIPKSITSSGQTERNRRRCHVCYVSIKKQQKSFFECKACGVCLCIEPCFELYHTKCDFIKAYKKHHDVQ